MKFSWSNHSAVNEMISFLFILGVVRTSWAGRLTCINFIVTWPVQGRNEVRWRLGKKQVWRPRIQNWGLLEAYVLCIEESTCDIVAIFRRPRSHWAPHALIGAPTATRRRGMDAPVAPIVTSLEPWLAVFSVIAAIYEKPKSISSCLNGCTIHDTEFRFNKAKNRLEN